MADDDPYDSDGDVGRFLRSPSPDDPLFSLSEPATEDQEHPVAPLTHNAAPEFGVQATATEVQGQPAPEFGFQLPSTEEVHGHPALIINAEHHGAPIINAGHHEAPSINGEYHQASGMNAGQYQALTMDVQTTHMLPPHMQRGYGEHFQAPIMDAHAPRINSEHREAPPISAEHHQVAIINAVVQPATNTVAPETTMMQMLQAYGAILDPTPTMHQGCGGNGVHGRNYQAPIMNAQHYQPPTINSEHYQPPNINAESHQAAPVMAMGVVQPATNTLAPEMMMQMQQEYGSLFPDPTPPMQQGGGGVDAALLLAGDSTRRPPSPTLYTMMDELAAMLDAGGMRYGGDAAEDDDARDVRPAADAEEDDVVFMPIDRGQLDCARCRPTREIMDDSGTHKTYFAVHSTHPGTFEHAIIDGMAIGADGQFHANDLLYCDLHGRTLEWVQNFITKSVEKMKNSGGQPQDICGPSNGSAAACANNIRATQPQPQPQDNISAPQPSDHAHMEHGNQAHNNISAPQPSNNARMELEDHAHMDLEIAMLNNILAGTAEQGAHPEESTQPAAQAQGNTDAPSVVEEPVTEVSQAAGVTQAQENTDAAPSDAEPAAAATTEAAPPESAQPSVTQAQEKSAGAAATPPVPDVAAPVPAAAEPSTSPAEHNTLDIGEQFAPFNWEGFKPDILESSELQPYDPASRGSVLMYPSLLEQLRQQELKKQERRKLSSMAVTDTPGYLNINDDHYANAPNFESEAFKRLCLRDPTYRLYKTRVSGLTRKIKKLELSAMKVGTGGLFAIKQKIESFKSEKEKIYVAIKRAMEVNGRRNDGAGPSNVAVATTNNEAGPSNVAATTSNNEAGPSNVAGTFNNHAGPSSAADCSNVAGPSGTK